MQKIQKFPIFSTSQRRVPSVCETRMDERGVIPSEL